MIFLMVIVFSSFTAAGRENGLPRPLPLSLIESKLLLDVRYRSAENMLAELNTVRKFN